MVCGRRQQEKKITAAVKERVEQHFYNILFAFMAVYMVKFK
jgi:hypothetical protein